MKEFDGRWNINKVVLVNKFNGNRIELSEDEWERIESGESVSRIYHEKIIRNGYKGPRDPYLDFERKEEKWH